MKEETRKPNTEELSGRLWQRSGSRGGGLGEEQLPPGQAVSAAAGLLWGAEGRGERETLGKRETRGEEREARRVV